ncbi:MAG: iron-sulfur cluster assembly protein, partial [Chromatiales bacterium]|nr:iron-sulfur cluster assembly protein [Chromatiales bacterium]
MSEVSRLQVETALKEVHDPNMDKNLVAAGVVRDIRIDGGKVAVDVVLGYPAAGYHAELAQAIR